MDPADDVVEVEQQAWQNGIGVLHVQAVWAAITTMSRCPWPAVIR
ncbi:hypothetical protein [Actinoallomurus bryophytorum]|nr:hypothetical protein [Actinoallomurus bryophytorum]